MRPPPTSDAPPAFGVGERIGRYEVEELLGRGGMGAVYRAFDPAANRHVALKILTAGATAENQARFQREVEVQGNIQHPHILPIYDFGTIGTSRYFTMELLKDPLSLSDTVSLARNGRSTRDSRLKPLSTLEGLIRSVLLPVCEAVYHANVREGVLHRDLKPENILIDLIGPRPFVMDFGVCSLLERKNTRLGHLLPELPARLAGGGVRVTGTLLYMPPEQARGNVDRRGDVWALGAILHFIVTGSGPVAPALRSTIPTADWREGLQVLLAEARQRGDAQKEGALRAKLDAIDAGKERSALDLQRDVLGARYMPRSPEVSRDLDAIISKAMAAEPERRYRHALDLRADLLAWLAGRKVRARVESLSVWRRILYRAVVRIRRHWKAAALLAVALGLGAWVTLGVLVPLENRKADRGATACLEQARAAAEAGRDDEAGRLAVEALGRSECADAARRLLARLDARRGARAHLDTARRHAQEAAKAFADGRIGDGRAHQMALQALLEEGGLDPLGRDGAAEEKAEVLRLRRVASGRRKIEVRVKGGPARIRAVPMDAATGRADWGSRLTLAEGADSELSTGRWLLGVDRRRGEAWWPILVVPGHEPLSVASPVDPGVIPARTCFVPGGKVRGPTGEEEVGPLFWERTEVTCRRYAQFLERLDDEERQRRMPRRVDPTGQPEIPLWEVRETKVFVPDGFSKRPVEGISLHDARAFAVHSGGRLPTAAEWAWAATGPDGRLCPVGDLRTLVAEDIRIADSSAGSRDVGTSPADRSPFGLQDMSGNVAEYTRTLATFRSLKGWFVMGGGYVTPLVRAVITEAQALPGWLPARGVGFRVVYEMEDS